MSIENALNALIEEVPQCELAGYVDLGSQIMLSNASRTETKQELLDRASRRAIRYLSGPDAKRLATGADTKLFGEIATVIVMQDDAVDVYLRSESEPDDILCCTCFEDVDVELLLSKGKDALKSAFS